jgi:hypothetical protein
MDLDVSGETGQKRKRLTYLTVSLPDPGSLPGSEFLRHPTTTTHSKIKY